MIRRSWPEAGKEKQVTSWKTQRTRKALFKRGAKAEKDTSHSRGGSLGGKDCGLSEAEGGIMPSSGACKRLSKKLGWKGSEANSAGSREEH